MEASGADKSALGQLVDRPAVNRPAADGPAADRPAAAHGLVIGPQPPASAPRAFPSRHRPHHQPHQPHHQPHAAPAPRSAPPRPETSHTSASAAGPASPAKHSKPKSSNESSPRRQNHQRKPRWTNDERAARKREEAARSKDKELSDKEDPLKIVVTGYPQYSQPQDLVHAFSKIGPVTMDKMTSQVAALSFKSADDASTAVEESMKMNVYGEFLTVRPFTEVRYAELAPSKPSTPKRDFSRNKEKGMIIDPKQIDLSGDFDQQLERILACVRLTQEDVQRLAQLYSDLETVLQQQWPGCTTIPFGSITTGLGVRSSDADCFVHVPQRPGAGHVLRAKRVLQQRPDLFTELLAIPRANTPIVKLLHVPTRTRADLTFKTPLGAQNSKLVAALLHSDKRLVPMAVSVKYWAKVHEFSGTGKLTNYALTLLIIFYLQQPPLSILPSVESLQRDPEHDVIVDFWNTGFDNDKIPEATDEASMAELIGGFYEYYSMFNFDEMAVCPYLGTPVKKEMFQDLDNIPSEFDRYKKNVVDKIVYPIRTNTAFCVQDPFEQCHNVASVVSSRLAAEIKAYFKFAANAYEKEKAGKCDNFFKTILLEKPKLPKSKSSPEYRVNLFPRIIVTIVDPDWRAVVRKLVFVIFEDMLRIKLGKVEEKVAEQVSTEPSRQKEKYLGRVVKPVWRRRGPRAPQPAGLRERQAEITDEILNSDQDMVALQFQLTLSFCAEPASAALSVRLAAGDLRAFRDFGKFFISVMQSWFLNLLRPFARPPEREPPRAPRPPREPRRAPPLRVVLDPAAIAAAQ